jgi:hypothetical protein
MATKAERFKSDTQRAAQQAAGKRTSKAAGKSGRSSPGTARDGLPHNTAARAGKNSVYEFEVSAARPSRKSTRRSPTHVKTDTALRLRATRRTRTPEARAARATAKRG